MRLLVFINRIKYLPLQIRFRGILVFQNNELHEVDDVTILLIILILCIAYLICISMKPLLISSCCMATPHWYFG